MILFVLTIIFQVICTAIILEVIYRRTEKIYREMNKDAGYIKSRQTK